MQDLIKAIKKLGWSYKGLYEGLHTFIRTDSYSGSKYLLDVSIDHEFQLYSQIQEQYGLGGRKYKLVNTPIALTPELVVICDEFDPNVEKVVDQEVEVVVKRRSIAVPIILVLIITLSIIYGIHNYNQVPLKECVEGWC